MTRKVLITGGTGFIGRWAVESLAEKGYEVHVCARDVCTHFSSNILVHPVDLLSENASEKLVQDIRPTHLLHLAWETSPGTYWTSKRNLAWVSSTLCLARAAISVGCNRLVATGTCAEYDWNEGGVVNEVRSTVAPTTLYGSAKAATFEVLRAYSTVAQVRFAWARLFFQYGPYERHQRLVPSVVRSVLAGVPVQCTNGEQLRDFLYSVDTGEALAALLDSDVEGAVNIGSGRPIRVKDLVMHAAELAGDASLVQLGARAMQEGEPLVLIPTVDRLQREVRWTPRYSLTESLAQTVEFWREQIEPIPAGA